MDILTTLTQELNQTKRADGSPLRNTDGSPVRRGQVEAAVRLIDEGNTIPFISRYRKEATGELTDEHLRILGERLVSLRNLDGRKSQVLASIEEQGKLTDDLKGKIEAASSMTAVEDLYRPYKPKRKTRAGVARAKGLAPLADYILKGKGDRAVTEEAARYVTSRKDLEDPDYPEEKKVRTPEDAVRGAQDIIAEIISDDAGIRSWIRDIIWREGTISSSEKSEKPEKSDQPEKPERPEKAGKSDRRSVYEMYFHFEERIARIPGYRILALNRGEAQRYLTVSVNAPDEKITEHIQTTLSDRGKPVSSLLQQAAEDAYTRLIRPAAEREIRSRLTEEAEDGAIVVFRKNLEQLLMQPPIAGKTVMGWDPAFRTGCKISVVDPTGRVLATTVVFPTEPQNRIQETKREIKSLIRRYGVDLIALGNGTASRESEQVIVQIIREMKTEDTGAAPVQYVVVNEAGASVYSASRLAAEEFPDFNVGQRSAVSMARRLQDPLAELVKIDPKAIGVGQYQHDMDQKKLGEALGGVVEDCVNRVGVDLNTASYSLLSYVSGITPAVAKNITAYREANGRFRNRGELLKVPKLGPKAYEQCAGFLRILDGSEPLDATAVHPENYRAVRLLLKKKGLSDSREDLILLGKSVPRGAIPTTAQELGIGEITLRDILEELQRPGRDPREDAPAPVLRSDVLAMEDLQRGMKLKGTVRNIVDFGAFVDIGVHQDGLVHISRLSDHFVRNPLEVVHVGQVVEVTVVSVDPEKKRIALTMNGKM